MEIQGLRWLEAFLRTALFCILMLIFFGGSKNRQPRAITNCPQRRKNSSVQKRRFSSPKNPYILTPIANTIFTYYYLFIFARRWKRLVFALFSFFSVFCSVLFSEHCFGLGKAKGVNDAEFQAMWKRTEEHCHLLDNIKKYMENYIRSLTALCLAEVRLSDDVALSFEPKHQMYEASLRNKDTIGLLDLARAEYDRIIKDDFLLALTDYSRQAGTLRRRKNERDRRKVDMDRYKTDYQRFMDKGDHTKAQQNKRKYGGMKIAYEALNAEMCNDMPLFINDKDKFFTPLFARFVSSTCQFYQRAAELYAELLPHFQHIDRLSIHEHKSVITPEEQTCANEPIDTSKAPDKGELQAYRSSYRGGGTAAPSSTGYMSSMGVQGAPVVPQSMQNRAISQATANEIHGHQAPPPSHYAPPPNHNNYAGHHGGPPPQPHPHGGYAPPPQQQYPQQPYGGGGGGYGYDQGGGYDQGAGGYEQPAPPYTAPAAKGPVKMKQPGPGGPGPKKIAKKVVKKGLPPGPGGGGAVAPAAGGGRPMPGGPGGAPQFIGQCRALYPFTGQDHTELNFQQGDVISLIRADPGQEWWEGELRGVRGLLPNNYVERF